MKTNRQSAIREIIEERNIETQEELAEALRNRGIVVTQATVSRDIKEMHLIKVLSKNGGYRYATLDKAEHGMSDRFIRILSESILSVESAGNLIVIKTITASANAGCEAIDSMKWPEVLGTIAGDNTILIIARSEAAVDTLLQKFDNLIKK